MSNMINVVPNETTGIPNLINDTPNGINGVSDATNGTPNGTNDASDEANGVLVMAFDALVEPSKTSKTAKSSGFQPF